MSHAERLNAIFKDIHQNPELGFMETRTADIVAKEFKALGYEVKTGIAKTGVVGIMKNGDGPTVMFRGDMDAIAVKEETACGRSKCARGQAAKLKTLRRRLSQAKAERTGILHAANH